MENVLENVHWQSHSVSVLLNRWAWFGLALVVLVVPTWYTVRQQRRLDVFGSTQKGIKADLSAGSNTEPKVSTSSISRENASSSNAKQEKSEVSAEEEIDNNWRCACEGGFLPPGLLKTFGGAEAVIRMGTGQCYHKKY